MNLNFIFQRAVSTQALCLVNNPSTIITDSFTMFTNNSLPGQFYTANDQCIAL